MKKQEQDKFYDWVKENNDRELEKIFFELARRELVLSGKLPPQKRDART